jgi:hypothetical protein
VIQVPTLAVFKSLQLWQVVCARLVMQCCWPYAYTPSISLLLISNSHVLSHNTQHQYQSPKEGNILGHYLLCCNGKKELIATFSSQAIHNSHMSMTSCRHMRTPTSQHSPHRRHCNHTQQPVARIIVVTVTAAEPASALSQLRHSTAPPSLSPNAADAILKHARQTLHTCKGHGQLCCCAAPSLNP